MGWVYGGGGGGGWRRSSCGGCASRLDCCGRQRGGRVRELRKWLGG